MDEREARPIKKVKVMDKRRVPSDGGASGGADRASPEAAGAMEEGEPSVQEVTEEMQQAVEAQASDELLDDLRRLQADFDNYRKRMIREQTAMANRASARLIVRLLPVLDNFERATAHGEGGPGIDLVHKELLQTLESEGLEEMQAEGAPFDPHLHEAVQVEDDPSAQEPVVRSVFRRGYRLRDQVLRPAMVVVARPPEDGVSPPGFEDEGEPGPDEEHADEQED